MSEVITHYCDVCGAELQGGESHLSSIPVLVHVINEYEAEARTRVEFATMDICPDCLDRAVVFETNVGAVCPVHGEGEYRMREFSFTDTVKRTVSEQHDRITALEAENETLRAECDEWHRVAQSKQDIIDHMRDANSENAKLREVCADAWILLVLSGNDDLEAKLTIGKETRVYDAEEIADRMKELGVEVPE